MKPRILIFEPNEALSSTLKKMLNERGYDVFTYSNYGVCPSFHSDDHICRSESVCSDVIISDLYMPNIKVLKLIKNQIDKGCKVRCRALMSTFWSNSEWLYAQKLGCKLIRKPFNLKEILKWLDDCAKKIDANRKLLNLPKLPE